MNKRYVEVELRFEVERFGKNYRPHFRVGGELLGVDIEDLPKCDVGKPLTTLARLPFDIDYSNLKQGSEFEIIEGGQKTIGQGRVLGSIEI